ncbi:Putative uncharacterized protein [Moritella viscosa]|uniref:hypothetical protein n=1 Tax=Moritella viscosa TaxID=80854 RepID=UPI00091BFD62|nr:hypothetical protein [Moritella viscosa]SGZ08022.1 Putative uncharacterized protein [Moritella viscosa]
MSDTLKSLKDRLSWIKNTEKQATWLHNYLSKQGWFEGSTYAYMFNEQGTEFLTSIKYEWSKKRNTAIERERISKARSAWNSYTKKSKNQTYSLSLEAKNKINQLATRKDITRSKVIEELVMQADSLDKLEGKIRKLLKSMNIKNEDGSTIKYNINSVSDVLKVSELKSELERTAGLLRESELELNELLAPTNKKEDKLVAERDLSVDTISNPDDNQSSKLTSTKKANNLTSVKNELERQIKPALSPYKLNESQEKIIANSKNISDPFFENINIAMDMSLFNGKK